MIFLLQYRILILSILIFITLCIRMLSNHFDISFFFFYIYISTSAPRQLPQVFLIEDTSKKDKSTKKLNYKVIYMINRYFQISFY